MWDRRRAQAFPIGTRWWILTLRWPDVTWRQRLADVWYLLRG